MSHRNIEKGVVSPLSRGHLNHQLLIGGAMVRDSYTTVACLPPIRGLEKCRVIGHNLHYLSNRPKEAVVHVIYPRRYEAEASNPEGITHTTASEGYM